MTNPRERFFRDLIFGLTRESRVAMTTVYPSGFTGEEMLGAIEQAAQLCDEGRSPEEELDVEAFARYAAALRSNEAALRVPVHTVELLCSEPDPRKSTTEGLIHRHLDVLAHIEAGIPLGPRAYDLWKKRNPRKKVHAAEVKLEQFRGSLFEKHIEAIKAELPRLSGETGEKDWIFR